MRLWSNSYSLGVKAVSPRGSGWADGMSVESCITATLIRPFSQWTQGLSAYGSAHSLPRGRTAFTPQDYESVEVYFSLSRQIGIQESPQTLSAPLLVNEDLLA